MLQVRAVLQAPAVAGPRVTISRSVLAGRLSSRRSLGGHQEDSTSSGQASVCLRDSSSRRHLDQMPAATPKHERLDETPTKAIKSTINNKQLINPAVTVRTGSRRTLPLAALARAPPI